MFADLLRQRLADTLGRSIDEHRQLDAVRFRALLFRDLQCSLCLTEEEKKLAHDTAINLLFGLLRSMPDPPVRVDSDRQSARANKHLREVVETAYSLRLRPSADMLQQLAYFCGGSPAAAV